MKKKTKSRRFLFFAGFAFINLPSLLFTAQAKENLTAVRLNEKG